jgi:hypothetical protein
MITSARTKNSPDQCPHGRVPHHRRLIFTYREKGPDGTKRLLARIFDYKRINRKAWYAPIILLMPAISILAYAVMRRGRLTPFQQHFR